MSHRKKGRITVQNQPTREERFMRGGVGAVHAAMGLVFVVVSVTSIFPNAGLFGLPFFIGGAFFFLNGLRMIFTKNDPAHRVGYDIERDIDGESIVGPFDDVDCQILAERLNEQTEKDEKTAQTEEYDFTRIQKRLEQLEQLKKAGMITAEEYDEKRRDILNDL